MSHNQAAERETKELVLPHSEKKIRYYAYLKAREMIAITKAEDGLREMINQLVVDVDGSQEGLYDQIMDLRFEDYQVLDQALLQLVKKDDEKKD